MKCPACTHELSHLHAGGIEIDACKGGCGGVWFDNFEFEKFDEPNEQAGEALLDIPRDRTIRVDHDQRRDCPKCEGITMMRRFFSPKRAVEIDECPGCGGIWLDPGELSEIRSLYGSAAERKQHTNEMIAEMFGSNLEALRKQSEDNPKRPRRLGNMLRFFMP